MLDIGSSAVEALVHLINEHPNIAVIRCVEYRRSKRLDGCNGEMKVPPSQDITARRLRHLVQDRKWHRLRRDALTLDNLLERIKRLPEDRALAVTSRVTLYDQRKRHIPMVDFRCEPTEAYLQNITEWMHEIDNTGGLVLKTTNSYHYYGITLLTDRQWVKFVGRCLLLVPDVDVRYLGHRLMEGWGSLRLSPDSHSSTTGNEPEVVRIIESNKR